MIKLLTQKLSRGTVIVSIAAMALGGAIGASLYRHHQGQQAQQDHPELADSADSSPQGLAKQAGSQFDAGNYAEAAKVYDRAIAADPQRAVLYSARGEARVMASQHDPMPPEAAADFAKALSLDAKDPRARYFMAVKQDLGGDHQGAIAAWLALLADTPPGAPWEADLRRTIEQVGKINAIAVAPRLAAIKQPQVSGQIIAQAIPGPSASDLQAAGKIPPGEQRIMAEGMVARLEERLRGNPANVDGWLMLMRSRMTLGQTDKATKALQDAIAANPSAAAQLQQQAEVLGIRKGG